MAVKAILISWGQTDTLKLEPVTIESTRINTRLDVAPLAVMKYTAGTMQDNRQQLTLQENLFGMPGLFATNATNFAQDLRISIRGFGARSAFGIRGIKLIVDGIPETTPDGQGQVDNLNLGIISEMEIVRGPTSALYGNASGGVINITTRSPFEGPWAEFVYTLGSFGFEKREFTWKIFNQNTGVIVNTSSTSSEGYRDQSAYTTTNANVKFIHKFTDKSNFTFLFNYANSPIGDDAGGITKEMVMENRRQALLVNRDSMYDAGEAIVQWKAGASYSLDLSEQVLFSTYTFFSRRDFQSRLGFRPGGEINFLRNYWGQGSNITYTIPFANGNNRMQLGYDVARQADDRRRFNNELGARGEKTLDQLETFSNFGVYLTDHLELNRWYVMAGARIDRNLLRAQDQITDDGDQSGEIRLNSFNPTVAISRLIAGGHYVYVNFATSFETPALTELANPDNGQGFNPDLKPQTANNYELGFKGRFPKWVTYQLNGFIITTQNEFVPFQLVEFPGRVFYRNSGSGLRKGIELFLSMKSGNWQYGGTYTLSKFRYESFEVDETNFSGKRLPGIPHDMGSAFAQYEHERGWFGQVQQTFVGKQFANDANTAGQPKYAVTNVVVGKSWKGRSYSPRVFFGINNLFNEFYFDNLRLNATLGRYYEPAPTRNFYAGVRVKFMNSNND
jgi:iron complex outermembrane recepter protein